MKINLIQPYNFHNINKPVVNTVQNPCQNTGMKELYPFGFNNYLSFSGTQSSNVNRLHYIGEENFPNDYILNKTKEALSNNETTTIYQFHNEYFGDLLNCETVEEVRQKYPEFENVIDAKDLEVGNRGFLGHVKNGDIEGLSLENLSLEILKRYYGKVKPLGNKDSYWNRHMSVLVPTMEKLNIPLMDGRYVLIVSKQNPNSTWQSEEYKTKTSANVKKRFEDPECRKQSSDRMKRLWNDPEKRAEIVAKMNSEENRQRQSELMKARLKDEKFIEKLNAGLSTEKAVRNKELANIALKMAWDMHPEIKQQMSEVAHEVCEVSYVFTKISQGQELTKRDKTLLAMYNKELKAKYPEARKVITQTQKEILAELKKKEGL